MLSRELQVEIDDIYSCLGCCPGCLLTEEERLATTPAMSSEVLDLAFARLAEYVPGVADLTTLNITFGIADHLLLPAAHTVDLYQRGAALIRNCNLKDGGAIFFSSSLVGKREPIEQKLREIIAARQEVPLIPVVVLDPIKLALASYGKLYADTFRLARDLFGRIDLTINLSVQAAQAMPPKALAAFVTEHGFHDLAINWVPATTNIAATGSDIKEIRSWLTGFSAAAEERGGISYSYRAVMERALDASEGNLGEILMNTVMRSLQIAHDGTLMAKLEAIGDIPYCDRFLLQPMGNLKEEGIGALIDSAIPRMEAVARAAHAKFTACAGCQYAGPCHALGFHVYNHFLSKTNLASRSSLECPHVAKELFAQIDGWRHHALKRAA